MKDYRDKNRWARDRRLIFYSKDESLRLYRQFDTAWHCDAFSLDVDHGLFGQRTIILILIKRDIIEARIFSEYDVSVIKGYDINSIWFQAKVLASAQEHVDYLDILPDLTEYVHINLY